MHYEIQQFSNSDFTISSITYDGQSVFLARSIGEQLGYTQKGKKLVSTLRGRWASEFIEGKDLFRVEGDDARFIIQALRGTETAPAMARSALLLTQSGVDLVIAKSSKPAGIMFRRWLVDEVLPALRRGEAIGGPAKLTPKEMTAKRLLMRERRQVLDAARRAGVRGHELHEMANIMVRDAFGFELSDPSEVQIPLGFTEAAKLRRIVDHAEAQGTVQPSAAAELRRALGPGR